MFQQGAKFYLNATSWKRYQHLDSNENKDKPRASSLSTSLSLNFKHLNHLKKSQKTGLKNGHCKYNVSSVKQRLANEAGSNTGIDIYKFKQKMANTLSVMTNVLRNVVSKQRIRYKEKGFNLDLAYIYNNIIAMGYPAEKYESMYRNRLEDVYKFLEEKHCDHYKIYNLCLERSYDITKFHGRVSVYPFEDHNPPTIEMILKFCNDIDTWLKADPSNVAAVHCKAGKGRTGTMICCYLLYSGKQHTAEDALGCYDEKRTKDRKGVTIPSQRRYVQYFSKLIRLGLPYERRTLQFCEIRFSEATVLHSQGTVLCSISVLQEKVEQLKNLTIDFRKGNVLDMKNPLPVAGDIKVELTKNTKKIFHFWFNTFFVTDSAVLEGEGNDVKFVYTLHKWEIDDAHKDKEHKYFSEDFKVDLVFYVDDSTVGREHMKVASTNRLTTNNRSTSQNAGKVRLPLQQDQQQQSNNYSLPQNSSSGSEMNFICDQKSSSTASVSSSLGGGCGTDTSNGYESNRSTTQRKSGLVAHPLSNHHHYMATPDATNSSVVFSALSPAQHMTQPPSFMESPQQQHKHKQHQQQKTLQQQQQQQPQNKDNGISFATVTSTPNQRHMLIGVGSGGVGVGVGVVGNATCQPSTNLNANNSHNSSSSSNMMMASTSYTNHSNNSSKTSSVSSQSSSSAIGDNEEDWESGESQAKQLENITLLLSTSSVTPNPTLTLSSTPTSPYPPSNQINPSPSSSSSFNYKNTLRNFEKFNTGILHSSNTHTNTNTKSSTTPPSNSPSNNKCKTSSSSCTNRVVGGDVDDDDDYDNDNEKNDDGDDEHDDDDDRKLKLRKLNSNLVVKLQQQPVPPTTVNNNKNISVESSDGDNNITCDDAVANAATDQMALVLTTPTVPSARPKLMHLLMAPKNVHQSSHKPIFKRKSSYKLVKGSSSGAGGDGTSSTGTGDPLASCSSAAPVGSGGVATTSKQKLKIKLKKNKLKLSQKFQWFQSYFRTDPVDFCENFVQHTTSMRHNSISSMASRTHKLSTTTPPSVTPPPLPVVNAPESSSEQLDRATSVRSVSTSNASIATGDLCEDYYSSICDNQLSFSNSPCKSPRSMADMARSISGSGGGVGPLHHGSFGSSFTRSAGSSNQFIRERRETLPTCSSHNNARRNVIIVAAKPAKTHAIGFNVNTVNMHTPANLARQESADFNADEDLNEASPASIYYTPTSALIPTGEANEQTNTAFVFPQIRQESNRENFNELIAASKLQTIAVSSSKAPAMTTAATTTTALSKPQAKYSLNLVIVNECCEPFSNPSTRNSKLRDSIERTNDESDHIDLDCPDDQHNFSLPQILANTLTDQTATDKVLLCDELEETDKKITATTCCASVCSNSSSSGFCTSECCTTNSSSSSCSCNPFALDLERHIAVAVKKQQELLQQTTIHESAEAVTIASNEADVTNENDPITEDSLSLELQAKAYNNASDE